jgi:hypothetical protein
MTASPDWRVYHAHMLRNARQAKKPAVKAMWLNGAARARRELAASKAPAAQRDLFA